MAPPEARFCLTVSVTGQAILVCDMPERKSFFWSRCSICCSAAPVPGLQALDREPKTAPKPGAVGRKQGFRQGAETKEAISQTLDS
jgi:hypothetical protein